MEISDYHAYVLRPALENLRSTISRTIVQIASGCVLTPVIELKVLFARHLQQLTHLLGLCAGRQKHLDPGAQNLEYWEFDVTACPALPKDASSEDLMRTLAGQLADLKVSFDAVASCVDHLNSSACRILDEPSINLGVQGSVVSAALRAEVEPDGDRWQSLRSLMALRLANPMWLWEHFPEKPERDSRFELATASVGCEHPRNANVAARYHRILMETEIPTIEACAANIVTSIHLPLQFVLDMSQQALDEARHAEACIRVVRDCGFDLGNFGCSSILWTLGHQRPLVNRLAIHQRVGETLGLNSSKWRSSFYRQEGETELSNIEKMIYVDEITHVAIGNKWIRYLCKNDEDQIQLVDEDAIHSWNVTAPEIQSGARKYPVDVRSLKLAGYSDVEADRLSQEAGPFIRYDSFGD